VRGNSFAQDKTRDFDLVIGAAGLHSNVRRLTFGPESDVEHYLGCQTSWTEDDQPGP
jgi:2-polyprenyl-6-methoxyphenol hydroxylase-like FAD-dependent oxidoreductase